MIRIQRWQPGQLVIVWLAALSIWWFVYFLAQTENIDASLAITLLFLLIPAVPLVLTWLWLSPPRSFSEGQDARVGQQVTASNARATPKPFTKALACGGILYLVLAIVAAATGMRAFAGAFTYIETVGYLLPKVLIASLLAGVLARLSKGPYSWNWGRIAVLVVVMYLLLNFLEARSPSP